MNYPAFDWETTLIQTFKKLAAGLAPPPDLSVSEWADTYRKLSSEASAEPGNWDTSRAEYQRGMMDAVSDPTCETVVLKTSSQVGKTEIINNVLGYYMHQDPAAIMVIQPTLDMAMAYSKDRLRPMLRDCPALQSMGHASAAGNTAKNPATLLHKTFPGGHLTMVGANSSASLASRPIRILLADEVDRAPSSAGEEGDPINLAKKRTTTFWNRKIVMVSTPTLEGGSRIDTAWLGSDQRRFYVPCPHCGHYQVLEWMGVNWPEDEPEKAQYMCAECATLWADGERWKAISMGEWRATKPFTGVAGFHISELYSPWVKLASTVAAFLEAKHSGPEFLQVWTNTAMGECWSNRAENSIDWHELYQRRESYINNGQIPNEIQTIVCSIDTQDDRFEMEFVGYGYGEESWGLGYVRLFGDPARNTIWKKLKEVVRRQYTRYDGTVLDTRIVTIDSGGHYTSEVYEFCLSAGRRTHIPIKGMAKEGSPIVKFPRKPGKDHRVYLSMVGTDTAKEVCYARYAIRTPGPGYCHFPVDEEYDEEYFQQLISEVRERRTHMGRDRYIWVPTRRRNEVSDVRVYSLAGLRILTSHFGIRLEKEDISEQTTETMPDEPRRDIERAPKKQRKKSSGFIGHDGGSWI